jgi:hypothetical protein
MRELDNTKNMPRPDGSPTGAAIKLRENRIAGSRSLQHPPLFFKSSFLARPIHESLRRGVSLFIKKVRNMEVKMSCADRAHCQQAPDNGTSGGTEYQRKRLPEMALINLMLIRGKGAYYDNKGRK